ncbi:hypothetical protein RO3G_05967 [Rhizopus delemar RA 99-880]|uniref:aminomethyltransferase n=1 Tax=Rhizopus delemar (strain RA 99-880 / ATCC MYA-4621 / FGSC 9543 / NRRL 43880) TaxID=246409 RepID=I1BYI2_RHIO9|nr:hypothetical protein RO3G_05967 [Rhizopus delemar RA 99-880]|eukprot:EIE81262.1 hypothetical protein RO3G_05967 [Rhizopus delemar RA 99-880]
MVPFAGYYMPVQYDHLGISASHLHTRQKASIFDVSHMLQSRVTGKDRNKFFERLVVADLHQLPIGQGTLSLFTNEQGGIIDDTIIMQQQDSLYVVTNAACADKDLAHIRKHLAEYQKKGFDVDFDIIQDHSLIALQGPKAAEVLEGLLSIPTDEINTLTEKLLAHPDVELAGLGARDSLRLEAGLCLYGHDLDETTTPVEAGLTWTIRNYASL